MLVYGDATRTEPASSLMARLNDSLGAIAALPAGIERHGRLVGALVLAGQLAQGVADGGVDKTVAVRAATMAVVVQLARSCAVSWDTDFAELRLPASQVLAACSALLTAADIQVKEPEGYGLYALYPESYLDAARALARSSPAGTTWQVIGIRSIGTSLSAMVAVGLNAAVPITLRPVGHPFARRIAGADSADATDAAAMLDLAAQRFAVVDEGPGLSGSSVGAVVEWLAGAGVSIDRVDVFASHANGPGPEASSAVAAMWARVPVHTRTFEQTVLNAPVQARRLERWVSELTGPLAGPMQDIADGRWRALHRWAPDSEAPVHPWQERRKYLATTTGNDRWLVKFAGLGATGEDKLARARCLYRAGFGAEPVGLRHGFLIERWIEGASPLPLHPAGSLRGRLLAILADYLAFRAMHFQVGAARGGASLGTLRTMARQNTLEAQGAALAEAWSRWDETTLERLQGRVIPIVTDNRLQHWEWLASDTRIVKTDALDHHAGHDLVGCQDVTWDVAGAAVEFSLSLEELDELVARVDVACGRKVDRTLLRFMRLCYLAFQIGYYQMALAGQSGQRADALSAARARYLACALPL